MNTSSNHGSAKIYQFPTRFRAAVPGNDAAAIGHVSTPKATKVYEMGIDACSYHQAAIQQSEHDSKH